MREGGIEMERCSRVGFRFVACCCLISQIKRQITWKNVS